MTEKALAGKAGHLELLKGGKKEREAEKKRKAAGLESAGKGGKK